MRKERRVSARIHASFLRSIKRVQQALTGMERDAVAAAGEHLAAELPRL